MTYLKLTCETCNEDFEPLRATSPEELLYPDYEDAHDAGRNNLESLKSFHEKHRGHSLGTIEESEEDILPQAEYEAISESIVPGWKDFTKEKNA